MLKKIRSINLVRLREEVERYLILYFASVTGVKQRRGPAISNQEETEAIASIDSFTLDEIKQGFIDGYLTGLPCDLAVRQVF